MSTDLLWFLFGVHVLAWFALGKLVAMSDAARDARLPWNTQTELLADRIAIWSLLIGMSAGVHVGLSADAVHYLLRSTLMCSVLAQAGAAGYITYGFEARSKEPK